jgi:hypothetical protein
MFPIQRAMVAAIPKFTCGPYAGEMAGGEHAIRMLVKARPHRTRMTSHLLQTSPQATNMGGGTGN